MSEWNYQRIQSLIAAQAEETLILEYKGADALQSSAPHRREITKDVSAMANAAGGTLIYGIAEHTDPSFAHLPERIDPVVRTQFSKETLEHVIGNIHPRITDLLIHPVPVSNDPDQVVYVVEIPQSTTAHQAQDKRYYKRFNFESVPMDDYEIRDVMFRKSHPVIELAFALRLKTWSTGGFEPFEKRTTFIVPQLSITAENKGMLYAQYMNAIITVPQSILWENWVTSNTNPIALDGKTKCITLQNTHQDVVGYAMNTPKYGPTRFDPVLPGMKVALDGIDLIPEYEGALASDAIIKWSLYADNAPQQTGQFRVGELDVIDERNMSDR